MDLDKVLKEALDGLWNTPNYGGYSDPPRKDFGPQSSQQGYHFPYQKGAPPLFPPTPGGPPAEVNLAWPLQTVSQDLADSFVYLLAAINKMENCARLNTGIESEQREKLKQLISQSTEILGNLKTIDAELNINLNLTSSEPPRTNPKQENQKQS